MKRSKWPLYSALTVLAFAFTGLFAWYRIVPAPLRQPYDVRELGLGTESTVVIAISSDCKVCVESIEFYKALTTLPGMDGKARKVVAVAMNGVWPVQDVVGPLGFKPHRLTSGPYMMRSLPGVSEPGTVLVLDAQGNQRGKWVGRLSPRQEEEIIKALGA